MRSSELQVDLGGRVAHAWVDAHLPMATHADRPSTWSDPA